MTRVRSMIAVFGVMVFGCGGDSPSNAPDSGGQGTQDAGQATDAASADAPATDAATDGGTADAAMISTDTAAYFVGDFVTNNVSQLGLATFPGPSVATPAPDGFPIATSDIDDISGSRDGSTVVIAGTVGTVALIRAYDSDLSNPRTLVSVDDITRRISDVKVSPDGSLVAFIADFDTDNARRLWLVPTDGSAAAVPLSADTQNADLDVFGGVAWSPNSKFVGYRSDAVTNNVNQLYVVDATATTPTPAVIVSQGQPSLVGFDASNRLYFRGDQTVSGDFLLYRADADGQNLEEVPFTASLTNGAGDALVGAASFNDGGSLLAFSADSPTENLFQVYVTPIATPTPVVVSNVIDTIMANQVRGPDPRVPMAWSADGTQLAVAADWENGEGNYAVFVVPTSVPAGGVQIVAAPGGGDTLGLAFALDSMSLFAFGDLETNANVQMYFFDDLTTANQDISQRILQDVPTNGDVTALEVLPLP